VGAALSPRRTTERAVLRPDDPAAADPEVPTRALRRQVVEALAAALDLVQAADARLRGRLLAEVEDEELQTTLITLIMRSAVRAWARPRGLVPRGGRLFAHACAPRLRQWRGVSHQLGRELQYLADQSLPWVDLKQGQAELLHDELRVEELGKLYESLLGTKVVRTEPRRRQLAVGPTRKRSGSFYTPEALTATVVAQALAPHVTQARRLDPEEREAYWLDLRVCDPALGTGAFLVEVCRQLAREVDQARQAAGLPADLVAARRDVLQQCLYGVDTSELAVAVAEASLWLVVGDPALPLGRAAPNLRRGNSLVGLDAADMDDLERRSPVVHRSADVAVGRALLSASKRSAQEASPTRALSAAARESAFHWPLEFPALFAENGGFDVVIGNPPWVAYAGRATQPLDPALRAYYARQFAAWRGYPTLQSLFVERSAKLAPNGVVALVLPSPLADLDGYRAARRAVTTRHVVREPLLEFGQDAFESVTQPCFALVADPSPKAQPSDACWRLAERQRQSGDAREVHVPRVLELLSHAPPLPEAMFKEMGFQSSRTVSERLFLRGPRGDRQHRYPLLEGRNVHEFAQDAPRLFLRADPAELARARVRLRPMHAYRSVDFVVRQTATVPIAALHGGQPFRNSLLAGFAVGDITAELAVGLLNSALYRALHLANRRDARQAAFPQVKIKHLRSLPNPPQCSELRSRISELARQATRQGMSATLREALDQATFDLFALPTEDRAQVVDFLARRLPTLGYSPNGSLDRKPQASLQSVKQRVAL